MSSDVSLDLENQLCFPLYAATRLTTKLYAPYLKTIDLTYPQYLVMLVLWKNNKQPIKKIGEQLFLETNTLTPLLKRMEQKGLISRIRGKKDEREVHISLTEKGMILKNKAKTIPTDIKNAIQDINLDESTLDEFKNTLQRLVIKLSSITK